MSNFLSKQSPARIIALGFAAVILIGTVLLMLPFSVKEGINLSYIDALYTSTSAVCVTGLIAVDVGTTFTAFGQVVIAILIQTGGLGVTSIGAGFILAMGRKMDLKSKNLIRDSISFDSGKATSQFICEVFLTTVIIELCGAVLSFIVFIQDFPFPTALGLSFFHTVAAFNNSGFDILGGLVTNSGETIGAMSSLIAYQDNILLNFTTALLIFLGGIGFLVIKEVRQKKFRWKKFSMHTKIVLTMSLLLAIIGTVLIKLTEGNNISWLGAFFSSISARTAGFSTFSFANFTTAGILVMTALMFIGASPGSTGGGIKTTTFFVLLQGVKHAATNRSEKAFKYSIPSDAFRKSAVITLLAISVVLISSFLLSIFEVNNPLLETPLALQDIIFEMTSAFGTVGLSTGITPSLTLGSKLVSIFVMFIGRLGPLTVATLGYFKRGESVRHPEGNISIG